VSLQAGAAIAEAEAEAETAGPRRRERAAFRGWPVAIYSIVLLAILLIPIVYTIAFSFNAARRTNIVWRGFTLDNWTGICDEARVCSAFGNSILVGVVATIFACALGTMIAIALARFRFRFRAAVTILLFLPMATPEVVLGAGLSSQWVNLGLEKNLTTVIIAHIMFCISFVVVTVRARASSLDPAMEEAGRDLYGSPLQVFWRITFPLLLPGIVAAGLLCFALSFDDFIITNFVSGNAETLPKYIYTAAARGIPPQANVFASMIFLIAIILVIVGQLGAGVRRRRLAREG
jgi:spermidine/putrescine transport system permease protein